jgi:hypothetical protein
MPILQHENPCCIGQAMFCKPSELEDFHIGAAMNLSAVKSAIARFFIDQLRSEANLHIVSYLENHTPPPGK